MEISIDASNTDSMSEPSTIQSCRFVNPGTVEAATAPTYARRLVLDPADGTRRQQAEVHGSGGA
jgi:hypothetical protein